MDPAPRITGGDALAGLAALEGIALEVFGRGDRPAGWFDRKLRRECAAPSLTAVLWEGAAIAGYFMVGAPPSRPGVAWASGLGVAPRLRGRGLGRALVEAALRRCAAAGLGQVELLAEPARVDFYRRLGFHAGPGRATLLQRARGRRSLAPPPGPYGLAGAAAVGGWLAEAWERTPAALRSTHVVALAGGARAHVHVSREGAARLVHRVLIAPASSPAPAADVVAGLDAVLEQIAAPTPVLLCGVDPAAPVHAALARAGWSTVQEAVLVARALRPSGPDRGPP